MTAGSGDRDDDDPLQRPASEAGWDDEPAPKRITAPAAEPPASVASRPSHAAATFPAYVPANPAPAVPTAPVTPTRPAQPAITTRPAQPAITTRPAQPAITTRPAQPVITTDSATQPVITTDSATQPVISTDSATQPAITTSPVQPAMTTDSAAVPAVSASPAAPAVPASPSTSVTPAASDEPLLPATYDENQLRAAVGASPIAEAVGARAWGGERTDHRRNDDPDDDAPGRPYNRKLIAIAVLTLLAGLAVGALVLLGTFNGARYALACEATRAVPEQGRAFPPWGMRALDGDAWKPLAIAPETRCQARETDDVLVLERQYLAMLLDQATSLLTAREITRLDDAEALLKQALLLTRPAADESADLAKQRNAHHQDIERLLGDVTYGRATARLRDAATALTEAAKQFEAAAAQHPRHATDAPAWASYARKLAQQANASPAGTPAAPVPGAAPAAAPDAGSAAPVPITEHPGVPLGTALPVEPDKPALPESATSAIPPASAAPIDAGVATGGVLL